MNMLLKWLASRSILNHLFYIVLLILPGGLVIYLIFLYFKKKFDKNPSLPELEKPLPSSPPSPPNPPSS